METKVTKIEIIVQSYDTKNTIELCSNYIISELNKTIKKAHRKYNSEFFDTKSVKIHSKYINEQ